MAFIILFCVSIQSTYTHMSCFFVFEGVVLLFAAMLYRDSFPSNISSMLLLTMPVFDITCQRGSKLNLYLYCILHSLISLNNIYIFHVSGSSYTKHFILHCLRNSINYLEFILQV